MKQTILTLLFIFCSLALSAQGIQVKGVVTSADDGQPLPGVSISVKGTATGSLTDAIGAYTINAPANSTLVFSFVGMKTQEILVKSSTTLNVVLQSNTAMMEEVVVVGYGVQKKSVVTGAISTVKSSDLADMPVTRIEDALKGRTSGVTVASSSGVPGADATVNIRGITSINSAAPLYVVDGVPVVGGIDYLNQGDIESIEILKDAASAAIYGTQAAAGVILISTKKGKSGAMQVNYNGYVGTQAPERKLNLLNAQEYATIMREARVAANQNIPADFPTPQSLGAGTDWQSVIFNNNAMIQNHEFNISGGNDKSTYYASVAYFDQEGIVATDISRYQRTTVRLNSAHKVNKWLNFGNNVSYSHIKSKQGFSTNDYFGGVLASAINLDPITTVTQSDLNPATAPYATNLTSIVRDADGYPYSVSKWVGQEMTNPAAYIKTKLGNYGWSDNIVGNIYMEIQPVKGLTFRTSMGTKLAFWGDYSYNPIYFLSNTNSNLSLNSISRSFNRTLVWTFTNTLSYTRSFNNHNLTFMVGTEARDQSNQIGSGSTLNGIPVTSWDQASMNYSVDPSKTSGWGYEDQAYTLASVFGRINYDYQGKYMLTAILRRDGSSRFGSNNVYGYFPSVSVGWVVSQESFWKTNDYVNFLKVRAGYGVNGNDNLQPFQYTSTIGSIGGYTIGGTNYTGYGPTSPANPDLKWEQTSQLNFGFDAKLLKNITAAIEIFKKTTTGMLMQVDIPEYVGASSKPWGNIASMWDKGLEIELGYDNKLGDLVYSIKGNASFTKNEITDIGSNDHLVDATMQSSGYEVSRKVVGEPVNEFYGFKYLGVFQTQTEINAYVDKDGNKIQPTAKPGDYKWLDVDGDGSITSSDRTWLGNPTPSFTYGFTLNLAYKGFDLVAFGQGVSGNKIFNELRRLDIPGANYLNSALGRWTGPGTSNSYARLVYGDLTNFGVPSQFYLQNGAYFRLKTMQIGYSLPKSLTERISIAKARVYVSGNNLFTLTKYEGFDPEIGGGQSIYGIDRGVYPQARSFMAGLDITF